VQRKHNEEGNTKKKCRSGRGRKEYINGIKLSQAEGRTGGGQKGEKKQEPMKGWSVREGKVQCGLTGVKLCLILMPSSTPLAGHRPSGPTAR
jgi:hypothetical protein